MVHKVKVMNDLNKAFIDLIERNIENRKQSVVFLSNSNKITLNSRGLSVKNYDDVLEIYRDDELKSIIDINTIIAVVTK